MKLNKYALILFGTFLIPTIQSCSDNDFLTEKPRTIYTTSNSFETTDQVKACVTNLYVHIRYWYDCNFFLKGLGSDVADEPYFRSSGNGNGNFASWSSSSNNSNQIFNAMYQLVNYANQSIIGVEKEDLAWGNESERLECYGEIMFMRGYGYLRLAEMFGGVPLVTEFSESLKLDYTRSTREETYQQAIADLKIAAENLPDYPSEAGRVAKGAAYHFLSEAYLGLAIEKGNNSSDLEQSISYADRVIQMHPIMTQRFGSRASESGRTINGTQAYREDGNVFYDLFQRDNQDRESGNTESLWVFQHDYNVYHEFGGNASEAPRNWSPVLRDMYFNSQYAEEGAEQPWSGDIDPDLHPGGNLCAYVGGRGVAFCAPDKYVIYDIWEGDFWNDMRNDPINIRRELKCINRASSHYGEVVTWDMLDRRNQSEFYPIWSKWHSDDDYNYDDLSEGWQRSNYYLDTYACRSAETILLRAEAKMRKNDNSGAAADINILRDRAQSSYKVKASDINPQFILDERARELFYEEQRWPTLLRMGQDGINSINAHQMYMEDQSAVWPDAFAPSHAPITKWTLFPIPQAAIDSNTGAVIEQNPGW